MLAPRPLRLPSVLPLAALWIAACAAPPATDGDGAGPPAAPPAWVTGLDPALRGRFFQGVGSARLTSPQPREIAEADARADIARAIRTHVRAELETRESLRAVNEVFREEVSAEQRIQLLSEVEMEGVEVREFWVDQAGGEVHCHVVLDRAQAAARIARRAAGERASAQALLERAQAAPPAEQLGMLAVALDHCRQSALEVQAMEIYATQPPAAVADPVTTAVRSRLDGLAAGLVLRVVAGDGQRVTQVGSGLPQPVVVQLTQGDGGAPVAGVPLRVRPLREGGIAFAAETVTTDAAGRAAFEVTAVRAAAGRPAQRAAVEVDVLAARRRQGPSVEFAIAVPTAAGTRIGVQVAAAAPAQPDAVRAEIARALTADGFAVGEGAADVGVTVQVTVEARGVSGSRQRVRAMAAVQLTRTADGGRSGFTADPADGSGADAAAAVEAAVAGLARNVARQVVSEVRKLVGID